MLCDLWLALQPVIEDLRAMTPAGPPSPSSAFNTLFEDDRNRLYLSNCFTNITAPLYTPASPPQKMLPVSANGNPVFAVVGQTGQFEVDPQGYMSTRVYYKDFQIIGHHLRQWR